jgi:hypothetical protein
MGERVDADPVQAPAKGKYLRMMLVDPFVPKQVDGKSAVVQSAKVELADSVFATLTYLCNFAPIFAGPGRFFLFSKGGLHWPRDRFSSPHAFSKSADTTSPTSSSDSTETLEAAKQFAKTFRRSLVICK